MQIHPQCPFHPDVHHEDSDGFFKRHYYTAEPRPPEIPPVTPENITIRQLGAMVETLVDSLYMALLGNDPAQQLQSRDITFVYPKAMPPSYVMETIGDYREAPSFFRWDKRRTEDPTAPAKPKLSTQLPQPVHFAEDMHRLSRNMGTHIGTFFDAMHWEGDSFNRVKDLTQQYDAAIQQFKDYVQPPRRKTATAPYTDSDAFAAQDPAAFAALNSNLGRIVTALKEELGKIPEFTLEIGGKSYTVSNRECMNPNFPNSHPARVIFAFRMAGKEGIDSDVHPRVGFEFLTDMFGVESDLMLTMNNLQKHLQAATGQPIDFLADSQRQSIRKSAQDNAHGLQLLAAFHAVTGRLPGLYPEPQREIASRDMATFLSMADRTPALEAFAAPREAATMLYAVERRFDDEGRGDAALRHGLRDYAQTLSESRDIGELSMRFSRDTDLQRLLARSRQIAGEGRMGEAVIHTLDQIQALVAPAQGAAAHVETRRAGGVRTVG